MYEDISDWFSSDDEELIKPIENVTNDDFVYESVQHDMFNLKAGFLYDDFGQIKKPVIYGGIAVVGLIGIIIATRK